jgi:predicted GIY-YIG superfamily endonuclease
MSTRHPWLFPPAQPLVERLGIDFFRSLPTCPGVYSMRNETGTVLYVGKARNLRQRLSSYRVANPERVSRRHLRLMQEVTTIQVELCSSESTALALEARLLRRFKPRYNRAGLWPGRTAFLTWRCPAQTVEFALPEIPPPGWARFGPVSARAARSAYGAVVRLIWIGLHPGARFRHLPYGWCHNRFPSPVTIHCREQAPEIRKVLDHLFWGPSEEFVHWVTATATNRLTAFDLAALQSDLDHIREFATTFRTKCQTAAAQLALL